MGTDTVQAWITIVGSALGIIVLGIGVLLFINGSYNKARMVALREDNQDLRDRVHDTEEELGVCKTRLEASDVKISSLEAENILLTEMITQRAEVGAIADLLEQHHREALIAWQNIAEAIERHHNDGH